MTDHPLYSKNASVFTSLGITRHVFGEVRRLWFGAGQLITVLQRKCEFHICPYLIMWSMADSLCMNIVKRPRITKILKRQDYKV